ncbi:MAG: putative Holliday junction resolvase [Candidatus Saccharibacteria bacterium]|nr:putative Holliday junction resolvase [Candidatus Saccharibacteria bacterium]
MVTNLLALDVGGARIGLAVASSIARIPHPLITIDASGDVVEQLRGIITDEGIGILVVGLPRNLSGEATAQTATVQEFASQLEVLGLPMHFQDEAVTSAQAEAELQARGKPYAKGDIDALAATYILDDFLQTFAETN